MRAGRTVVSSLVAGALALSLVAAETAPAETSSGTASTSLLGAEVSLTGPFATPLTRILDVDTSATTEGTPRATASVVPIELADGTTVGEAGASSDGQESTSSDGVALTDLGGALDLAVSPIEMSATASADRALATIGAATAQLDDLLGALGLDLNTAGVTSLVASDGASATQGLQVSGLSLDLGALGLDAEVLATLGLGDILDLLGALPGLLPADLPDVAAIFTQLDELDVALAALPDVAAPAQDSLDQLVLIETVLDEGEVAALDEALSALTPLLGMDVTVLLGELTDPGLVAALDSVGCPLGSLTVADDLAQALDDAIQCVTDALIVIRDGLSAGEVEGLVGVDAADLLATLNSLSDDLLAALPAELDAVVTHLDGLTALVGDILTLIEGLEDLLAELSDGDLLERAANLDLLSVGAFNVGTSAVARDTVADSSATVLCDAVDVTVLGEAFATPDCSEALDGLPDVTGAIAAAVAELAGVLNTLPLGDLVEVGELRANVFTDVVEQVTDTAGVVTATAGFDLLDLAVPSVTLDPSQVTSTLDDLTLPDVVGPIENVLADLTVLSDQLAVLGGLGEDVGAFTAIVADAEDRLATLTTPLTEDLEVDTVVGLAEGLGLGTLVDEITTPGLTLLIAPTSTATFQAAASDGTGAPAPEPTTPATDPTPTPDPAPAPTPTPAPEPTLPSTGGGLALMGLLALAGAGSLRRRR